MTRGASQRRRLRGDRGEGVVVLVLATGFVLLLLAQIINVIVFSYGKGTVRTALDEAARAGARSDSVAVCQATADQVMSDLMGGALGAEVSITCSDSGRQIVATASVHFEGWLTSLADYNGNISASAAKEDR
jgi:Flp pilus assembly protein TadG